MRVVTVLRSVMVAAFAITFPVALALAQAPKTKAEFIAVVEARAGCFVAEEDAEALLLPMGFTKDVVQDWAEELVADGLATVDETGLTLKTEKCS